MTIAAEAGPTQPAGPEPETPDFYRYRWDGLAAVAVDGSFLDLAWPDGRQLRVFDRWLRENAVGLTVDVATREGVIDPADLTSAVGVDAAEVDRDGALVVRWHPDGAETRHHPGWLRHVAEGRHRVASWLPEPRPWRAAELGEPPTHDGRHVLDDPAALLRWLVDLGRFGIARLRGTPSDPELVGRLAAALGPIRDTNFGPVWDVRAEIDPTSTAFTELRLGPHTDLPTRETPPGYQLLHCLVNEADGGEATMADGLAVVDHLRTEHPDDYAALTTLRWIFFSRGRGIDHRWSAPIVDLGADGSLTIRAFHPVRGFPDMADADLPRAYDAIARFSAVAADPAFQLRFRYEAGDLVGFDNRRILHGRDRFGGGGLRHLRGCYLDNDDVRSFLRTATRRAADRGATR